MCPHQHSENGITNTKCLQVTRFNIPVMAFSTEHQLHASTCETEEKSSGNTLRQCRARQYEARTMSLQRTVVSLLTVSSAPLHQLADYQIAKSLAGCPGEPRVSSTRSLFGTALQMHDNCSHTNTGVMNRITSRKPMCARRRRELCWSFVGGRRRHHDSARKWQRL